MALRVACVIVRRWKNEGAYQHLFVMFVFSPP